MAMTRKGKDQDKNRGSVAESIKEFGRRMDAARMSRMQGRSNLTSKDLEGKASGGSATMLEAPNGKEYMGPAFGEYKAKKKEDQPKAKAKPRQRRGAGREDMMSNQRQREIMEREERKRKNNMDKGGSNVVGS
jgi:hypothetical protein